MRKSIAAFATTAAPSLALTTTTGCFNLADLLAGLNPSQQNNNSNNNSNDDNTGDTNNLVTPTKSNIAVHTDGAPRVGEDVVAYGTGGSKGVDWVRPSAGDTAGRGINNSSNFNSNSFAVAKKIIYLTDGNFQVTTYNTATGTPTTIDIDSIRLKNIPTDPYAAGHIQAAGNYCAVICDQSEVSDANIIKVIDMSSGTPSVIAFTQNPVTNASQVSQIAISEIGKVVMATSDKFYVYDVSTPTAEPLLLEAGSSGIGDAQMQFDGNYVIFQDDAGEPNAKILNATTGSITTLANNPSAQTLALGGGSFGYFVDQSAADSNGNDYRSAIGTVSTLPTVTLGVSDDFIDGATTNNGLVGFGQRMCVTPDGKVWFMAGSRSIGSGEYLQISVGGAFTVVPESGNEFGCPASDVCATNTTLAFKTGSGTNTTLGYAVLSTTDIVSAAANRQKP